MDAITTTGRPCWALKPVDWVIGGAILSSIVFVLLVAVPAFDPPGLKRHAAHLPMLVAHIGGGTVMLLAGAVNLRIGLTRQGFAWHRRVGYTYAAAGTLASVTALIRSFDVGHTPGISTGTLAAVWLAFTAMAVRAIRNRRVEQHREWMIRSYVVAWTFVFCRFWSRAMPADLQGSERDMIWLTWVAPVLIAEIMLQWRRGAREAGRATR